MDEHAFCQRLLVNALKLLAPHIDQPHLIAPGDPSCLRDRHVKTTDMLALERLGLYLWQISRGLQTRAMNPSG